MSAITTHILDTSRGQPARGVPVTLEIQMDGGEWKMLGGGETDAEGRLKNLLPTETPLEAATYRLTFDTGGYFSARQTESFYPQVTVIFTVRDARQHHHVPLLLNPYGYSTYRGS